MLPIKRRIELTPQATQACLLAVAINPRRKKKPRSVTQLWFSASQMPLKWVSSLNQWLKSCQLKNTRKSQVFCDNTDKNKLWKRDQWKPIKKLTRAFEDVHCKLYENCFNIEVEQNVLFTKCKDGQRLSPTKPWRLSEDGPFYQSRSRPCYYLLRCGYKLIFRSLEWRLFQPLSALFAERDFLLLPELQIQGYQ